MENWVFNKKEIRFIADLMLERLQSLPDNSELSVINLFEQVLSAEYIRVKHEDGFYIQGYRITDIALPDGKYLHDFVIWDFDNGLWDPHIKQGFALEDAFYIKAKKNGLCYRWFTNSRWYGWNALQYLSCFSKQKESSLHIYESR